MAFKVFLSYSLDPAEQALAWRLQTLAAAHGIEMFVPQHAGAASLSVPVSIRAAIDGADCVLAIIAAKTKPMVRHELEYAFKKRKLVIPIVHSDFSQNPLLAQFPQVFVFAPGESPGRVEAEVVEFLKQQRVAKDKQQAIGALVAVGLGLLLLSSLSEK